MTVESSLLYREATFCRGCQSDNLIVFWSGGEHYIVNFLKAVDSPAHKAPIVLCLCSECGLVQLKHTVNPDVLYHEFFYRSGINEMMRAALKDVCDGAMKRVALKTGDAVLDIGCNDGTLLMNYPYNHSIERDGVDPAKNIQKPGMQPSGWNFINDYFHLDSCGGKMYKVITAIAMFYDLDKPLRFCRDVQAVLHREGVFVVQMNYLGAMLATNGIDNVSHEHLCYYSLSSLTQILARAGLHVFDVEQNAVNGGSLRVYACVDGLFRRKCTEAVTSLMAKEKEDKLDEVVTFAKFIERVKANCKKLDGWLFRLREAKKVVYCYGASTRGLALLQMLENTDVIQCASERDPNKIGRFIPGTKIKIIPEVNARRSTAEFMLVLPWHFWPAIKERERDWMLSGGKFIIPFPTPKIVAVDQVGQEQYLETIDIVGMTI